MYKKAERNAEKFYQNEVKKLDHIGITHKKNKKKYSKYFDPNLIFKIKLTAAPEESLRNDLRRAGIETISSTYNKTVSSKHKKLSYWIAFTDDVEFQKFRRKLQQYRIKKNATFIDPIEGIEEIPSEEKLGKSLQDKPLAERYIEYLDIEIWRMEDERLEKFIVGLNNLIEDRHGEISDKLITKDFCALRVRCDYNLFWEITRLREIAYVDRPTRINIESSLNSDIEDFKIEEVSNENKPGILIADSGINSHPLIEKAIKDKLVIPSSGGGISEELDIDDVGHGTTVAGIALYGDIKKCIEAKKFDPQIWLYSAKIMYRGEDGHAVFDEKTLVESQLKCAIEETIEKHHNCKIINISFGNSDRMMTEGRRQFRIAALIDELSIAHSDILFTISAGNHEVYRQERNDYPRYLIDNTVECKIIDPATSAHAVTVGSIFPHSLENSQNFDFPSHFTRVGPGLQGMVKPELVDYGGSHDPDLIVINPRWIGEGRLFTLDKGTSLSAPKIAHYLAKLKDAFPDSTRNYLVALLLSSATIPRKLPEFLKAGKVNETNQNVLNVCGYGKPDLDRARYSESNRVLLTHDGEIGIGRVDLFPINIPVEFLDEGGERTIEVTLVFDPPTNSNRSDYLGVIMEYHLVRDSSIEDIRKKYGQFHVENESDENIDPWEIKMLPGLRLRGKGAHQKSIIRYVKKPKINIDKSLVLVVICRKKWFGDETYRQPYSVIVTFSHNQEIDLYNTIELRNRARARVR